MSNAANDLGYTTYYLGAPEDIIESNKIYLVKDTSGITLQNLQKKFLEILNNPENFSVPTYNETHPILGKCFSLVTSDSLCISRFNTIIYLSNDGPVGYTTFYDDQEIKIIENKQKNEVFFINKINIYINFNITTSYIENVPLINSLINIRIEDEDSNKILIDNEKSYNFVSIPKILKYLDTSDNYIRYTNNISQAISDSKMCISTDTISYNNGRCFQYALPDFEIRRNPHPLTKIQQGRYLNNLFIFQWNSHCEFVANYINIKDRYGNLKEAFRSSNDYLNSISEYGFNEIEMMSYNHILLKNKNTGEQGIYNIKDKYILKKDNKDFGTIIDPMDNNGELIFVDYTKPLKNSIISPKIDREMSGILLNIKNSTTDLFLVGKIGSWFIFKSKYNNITTYSNMNGVLNVSGEVKNTPIIINDRCILIQDENESKFFFFDGDSHYCSVENNSFNENVIVVNNYRGKLHQLIEGFRHTPMGEDLNLPQLSCSIFGTLFYIEDNKLKKL